MVSSAIANPHLVAPLTHLGAREPRVVVIMLHGRTHDPGVLARDVVDHLDVPGVAYVAPTAAGRVWYPRSFLAPFAENEPDLGHALASVDVISDAWVERGVPREAQVILGFSQGACLACEYVYRRRAQRFGALIAFTGGLLGPRGTNWDVPVSAWAGMPVVLGGSREDPWVPYDRMQETATVMRSGGAVVESYYKDGDEHAVYAPQLRVAQEILASLAGQSWSSAVSSSKRLPA
jgi:phospholipase/carboxylesterase